MLLGFFFFFFGGGGCLIVVVGGFFFGGGVVVVEVGGGFGGRGVLFVVGVFFSLFYRLKMPYSLQVPVDFRSGLFVQPF